MKEAQLKVDNNRLKEIESQFAKIGISPPQYPQYSDPDAFGRTFKQCTLLKEVPLITTDSSTYQQ